MKKKLLIVNSFHPIRKYIPMGTFGVCDFLNQQRIESKIFNASIYADRFYLSELKCAIDDFRPDYIGLIIHWQETLENAVYLSDKIKKVFPNIIIVAGGLTAGFFGEELLERFKSIDLVIKGDPERPLGLLLTGNIAVNIPNLVYRDGNKVKITSSSFMVNSEIINSISYSKLKYLIKHNEYIKQINHVLGFPVFIGRGCVYSCLFCGGSKAAFIKHSKRQEVVYRSIESVTRDLKLLLGYTDNIYLCYEVNAQYIYGLFTAILSDKEIANKFRLNYGAWHLMDSKLLDLYSQAFKFNAKKKSIIELSPDTSIENDRLIIKDKSLYFTNKQLFEVISAIITKLNDRVRLDIYYSRYHLTQNNKQKLISELNNIHLLREYICNSGFNNVTVNYLPLSTDVGSTYWNLTFKKSKKRKKNNLLLNFLGKIQSSRDNKFLMANHCVYFPKQLTKTAICKHEQLIIWVDLLIETIPLYFFNITKTLGFYKFITILEEIIGNRHILKKRHFSKNKEIVYLLDIVHNKIKCEHNDIYEKNTSFFNDLSFLHRNYLDLDIFKKVSKNKIDFAQRPLLDKHKFCVTNYMFKSSTNDLGDDLKTIVAIKTVNLFCFNQIYSFEYKYYKLFKLFNGINSLKDILDKINKNRNFREIKLLNFYRFILQYYLHFTIKDK